MTGMGFCVRNKAFKQLLVPLIRTLVDVNVNLKKRTDFRVNRGFLSAFIGNILIAEVRPIHSYLECLSHRIEYRKKMS